MRLCMEMKESFFAFTCLRFELLQRKHAYVYNYYSFMNNLFCLLAYEYYVSIQLRGNNSHSAVWKWISKMILWYCFNSVGNLKQNIITWKNYNSNDCSKFRIWHYIASWKAKQRFQMAFQIIFISYKIFCVRSDILMFI